MRFELDVNRRNVPNAVLLGDLKSVAARLGKATVTIQEYDRLGTYSSSCLRERFGAWKDSLCLAGLAVEHHNAGVTIEDAVADLQKTARILEKETLTQPEYSLHGQYSPKPLIRHFGSWLQALEAAGLKRSKNYNIPPVDLFKNLETMWCSLGRQPRYAEVLKPFSAFSHGTYEQRFGSWRKALEAFVEYINSATTSQTAPPEPGQPSAPAKAPNRRETPRGVNWRLRFLVMRRDNFLCRMCGATPSINPGTVLVVDHIHPWAKGGETVLENLQTLCQQCNGGKSDLVPTNG